MRSPTLSRDAAPRPVRTRTEKAANVAQVQAMLETMTVPQIAEALGRTRQAVNALIRRHRLQRAPRLVVSSREWLASEIKRAESLRAMYHAEKARREAR